jgi:hypothetical protein
MADNSILNSILAQINALNDLVNTAAAKVKSTRAEYDRLIAEEADKERAIRYFEEQNDYTNRDIVVSELRVLRGVREAAGYAWEGAKRELDAALVRLNEAKANLSAAEQSALNAQLAAAQAQAQADITKSQSQARMAEANFMAQNTKYFIIGAVVLVIVIGVVIYLKRKKKVA